MSAKVERRRSASRVPRLRLWSVEVGLLAWYSPTEGINEMHYYLQTRRARIVASSSPVRRMGSMRNSVPSSSPTPMSPPSGRCLCGSMGGALGSRLARRAGVVLRARLSWKDENRGADLCAARRMMRGAADAILLLLLSSLYSECMV